MILAIDIGNTNIVLGSIEGETILFEARMATDLIKTSDQYCAELKAMLELFNADIRKIDGCIISSVVPPVLNSFRTAVKKLTGLSCMIVGPGIKTGLNIRTDDPAEVGGDLITAAVAAIREYGAPLLIIDMGTATTITAIDAKGTYLGGCICPGVKISMEALSSRTAQLPGISLDQPKCAIGRNTIDCMRSGIMLGAAAMLDGLLDRMEAELGGKATVVATGGISKFVVPLCRRQIICDKSLVLKGLRILYDSNCAGGNRTK
jgi:type III pantothenate kinase